MEYVLSVLSHIHGDAFTRLHARIKWFLLGITHQVICLGARCTIWFFVQEEVDVKRASIWVSVVHAWILQGSLQRHNVCLGTPCPVETGILNLSQVGRSFRMVQFRRGTPNGSREAHHLEQGWSEHGSRLLTRTEVAKQELDCIE